MYSKDTRINAQMQVIAESICPTMNFKSGTKTLEGRPLYDAFRQVRDAVGCILSGVKVNFFNRSFIKRVQQAVEDIDKTQANAFNINTGEEFDECLVTQEQFNLLVKFFRKYER